MERDCKTLNLDECRTRADCGTRKKPKSDELMCFKKPVRAPKQDVPPALVRKAAVAPKAPRMTAAHKAELRDDRPKLAFGKNGSLCAGMTETDCGKAKTACNWVKESKDGTKAYCGMRTHGTKYEGMPELSKFNSKRYYEEEDEKADQPKIELSENAKRAARWGQAYNSSNANVAAARASRKGMTELCAGMGETDCLKPSVQMACKWTKASADGKRKGHCGKRTDSNLESAATAKEMAKKFAELDKKHVVHADIPAPYAVISLTAVDEFGDNVNEQFLRDSYDDSGSMFMKKDQAKTFMMEHFEVSNVVEVDFKDNFVLIKFDLNDQTRLKGDTLEEKLYYLAESIERYNQQIATKIKKIATQGMPRVYEIDFLSPEEPVYMKSIHLLLN